jgi:hypothetical protein
MAESPHQCELTRLGRQGCQRSSNSWWRGTCSCWPRSKMLGIALVFIWGPNAWIYTCTKGGEYTKNPLEKYNNRDWRGKTDNGCESKPSWRNLPTETLKAYTVELWHHHEPMILWSCIVSINTNMLSKLILYRTMSNTNSPCTVSPKRSSIETETPKSSSKHRSQVTSAITGAIALNSTSALKQKTTTYFLVFPAMREQKIQ